MTTAGVMIGIILAWAWGWPEQVGKWCAKWRDAYDNARALTHKGTEHE